MQANATKDDLTLQFWQKIEGCRLLLAQAYFSDYKIGMHRFQRFHLVDRTSSDRLLVWSYPKFENDAEYQELVGLIHQNSGKFGVRKNDKSLLLQQKALSNGLSKFLSTSSLC